MSNRKRLSPLCAAFKRTRAVSKQSQEVFAAALGVTATSVSRCERGITDPASFVLLSRLEVMARKLGLEAERALFATAVQHVRHRAYQGPIEASNTAPPAFPQWRVALGARLLAVYFPDRLPDLEIAMAPALTVIDEVCRSSTDFDARRLECEIFEAAEQQAIAKLKQGK